ncbi:MAG: hypothetical protein DSZ10_01455 [Sulfurovum sp.]|nr:MAG: hypothetical protein DSZ10_01455 [Sulfurovum sp.]
MFIKEIKEFSEIRAKARAYLCYIISRHISQTMQTGNVDQMLERLKDLQEVIPQAEAIYIIDGNGIQIVPNVSKRKGVNGKGEGEDRSNRAYFYRTIREHRCTLTDPYPSIITNELVVTASFPVYDANGNLLFIVAVDIALKNLLRMVHPSSVDSNFGITSKVVYGIFSVALFGVALLLFIKGISSFLHFGMDFHKIDINEVFKSTILLTLSLAIIDLVKAIFEEEVLGKEKKGQESDETHQTMVKFLGSIIIALSIEALMLVFKSALIDPTKIEYAVYLIIGVSFLLISLSVYIKFSRQYDSRKKK